MNYRYTVTIAKTRTVRVDVPEGMTHTEVQLLLRKEAERLLDAGTLEVEMSCVPVNHRMVQDAHRNILRVSDDRARLTDEEVRWAGEVG